MRRISLPTLSMLFLVAFVNAESSSRSTDKSELSAFVARLLNGGRDGRVNPLVAKSLGFPGEVPTKVDGTDPEEATDNLDRNCHLVIDKSGNGTGKPEALVLSTTARRGLNTETSFFRMRLDGSLERALITRGKIDEQGNGVPGSAVDTPLGVSAKTTKALLQHELDFWLKGMYRTKLGKLRSTNPNATMADVEALEAKEKEGASKK